MRRENRKNSNKETFDTKQMIYISGGILIVAVIAFLVAFLSYGNDLNQDTTLGKIDTNMMETYDNTQQTSSEFGKTVNEMEQSSNTTKYAVNTSSSETNTKKENTTEKSNDSKSKTVKTDSKKTTKTSENKKEEAKELNFKKPVEGEHLREYAQENLVYSNTLGEWITHLGIDIKADKATVVKSSELGIVKSIKNDPRYGLTVVIEHANDYESIYSNLLTAEFVVEGEEVKQGQTIGTVGTTSTFEIADEPHLHFEIKKDGKNINPSLYIKD